jgi:hypothetical protein
MHRKGSLYPFHSYSLLLQIAVSKNVTNQAIITSLSSDVALTSWEVALFVSQCNFGKHFYFLTSHKMSIYGITGAILVSLEQKLITNTAPAVCDGTF